MNKKITISIGLLLIVIIPVWIWGIAPQLTKIPDNFSYRADVVSLDNFYDEASQKYSGEKRSVTTFSYDAIDKKEGVLDIKNSFDVRKITGEKIFTVERMYGIDPATGKHVASSGDRDREGYLFAPRNLEKGEPFTYWHINYDAPAQMTFAGEKTIDGLHVYRYETRYEGVKIDQTKNLGNLPGVGITRGIELEPYLQIWIEPKTGRMVQYKDDTIAYYYDLKTGKRQNPWNRFSNTYTRDSVMAQADLSKNEKLKQGVVDVAVPVLLGLIAFCLLVFNYRKKVAIIMFLFGLFGISMFLFGLLYTPTGTQVLKVGIARWVESPIQETNIAAFKDALAQAGYIEGRNIEYIIPPASSADAKTHKNLVQSLVDQNVNLIYSLTTPGTLIAKSVTTTVPIVFSIVTYPVETGIVDSLQNSQNNLVGTTNWVSVEDQLSVFRELAPKSKSIGFVHRKDEPNSTIQFHEMQASAKTHGINIVEIAPSAIAEIIPFLEASRTRIDSLYLACDTLIQGEQQGEDAVIAFAKKYNVPDFSCIESGVRKGSLVGNVADFSEIGKRAGEKAGLILQGATPQSLETNTVARPFIYINQTTATSLGITIPQTLLTKVKEIIQ